MARQYTCASRAPAAPGRGRFCLDPATVSNKDSLQIRSFCVFVINYYTDKVIMTIAGVMANELMIAKAIPIQLQ